MERHLATMNSSVPEHLVDKVGASSTTPEDLQAPSDHDGEHVQMQAASSANKAVPDMAEPKTTTGEDDMKASTTPNNTVPLNPKKTGSIRVKAQRSRPRLLTLLACVSHLLFQLLGVDLGLRLVNSYTEPRLDRAKVQLQAAMSDLVSERIVRGKLDSLLDITLERQHMETYEQCLARALYKADKVFLGIDFIQFPDVRNQTMEWATENCDRLLYTPQLHNPNPYKLWATANNVRRAAGKAFELFKYKAVLLRRKFRGTNPQLAAKPTVMQAEHTTKKHSEVPEMPFGFSLDCKGPTHCCLAYSEPSPVSATDKKTAAGAVVKASKEVFKWSYSFERAFRIIGCMINLLSLLQPLLMNFLLLAVRLSRPRPQPQSQPVCKTSRLARAWSRFCNTVTHLQHEEKLALGLIINTALYVLLHYQFDFITSEFDRLLLPAGLGFCTFHIPQALAFLNPTPEANETLRSFCRATHELYLIIRGAERLLEPTSKTQPSSARSEATASPNTKPASKIAARFISPLTPISEDLVQERKAMHAEQGKQPRDDVEPRYGYAAETGSEYDSDVQHASYVDLTGGATPTVFEDEEDWSIVED